MSFGTYSQGQIGFGTKISPVSLPQTLKDTKYFCGLSALRTEQIFMLQNCKAPKKDKFLVG